MAENEAGVTDRAWPGISLTIALITEFPGQQPPKENHDESPTIDNWITR